MITFAPEAARDSVVAALEAEGARALPYQIARRGLQVSRS